MTVENPFAEQTELLPAHDVTTLDGRIKWLQQRREGIGSSDCSSVLGLNPWPNSTPWAVFMDKTAQVPLDDGRDSEQMEIGREVESAIVRIAARRLGVEATTLPAVARRDRPWQRSNIDAVLWFPTDDPDVFTPIPLEAKNTSEYLLQDWIDQIPDHPELQILHTLAVTGAPFGYVAGMVGGRTVVLKRVDRDDELLDHITRTESELWSRVLEYRALMQILIDDPTADVDELQLQMRALEPALTSRDTVDAIMGVTGRAEDLAIVDPITAVDARHWWQRYLEAQQAEKDAERDKAEARNNLIRLADGHDGIAEEWIDPDTGERVEKVIARVQRGNFAKSRFIEAHPEIADVTMKKVEVLDVEALKNEQPDLYKQFQSRSIRGPRKNDPK